MAGAKICVMDTRLSNTASMADYWLPTWPGSEAAVLLAIGNVHLREDLYDREFVRRWVNWEEYLREERPDAAGDVRAFVEALKTLYAQYTPEFAEQRVGRARRDASSKSRARSAAPGRALAAHVWRGAAAGNLGGWQVARALELLIVLTGAVGTPGRHRAQRLEQVRAGPADHAAAGARCGTSCCGRASIRSRSTR